MKQPGDVNIFPKLRDLINNKNFALALKLAKKEEEKVQRELNNPNQKVRLFNLKLIQVICLYRLNRIPECIKLIENMHPPSQDKKHDFLITIKSKCVITNYTRQIDKIRKTECEKYKSSASRLKK